ncbi:MAG TPA: 2-amino-4-hydroxy-6-hydroxymethyldihydropteridine diphosphokinase [Candidatus Aminicenantes bacterium]|nr:2-amino-4-hydroxy-6-hydroxymethyldihydropteridine diphosphokinase [Candidatus Aminicenantes bacterium]
MRYFLSLGSNLGDKEKNLTLALFLLEKEGVEILKMSSLHETQPVDFPSQPWFYNQLVEVRTKANPEALLDLVKKIEQKMRRKRGQKKGPRIIDIDIILAEDSVIRKKDLKIPHPKMEKRNFVLLPFIEISPDTVHPVFNEDMKTLWKKSDDRSIVKQIKRQAIHKE